MNFVKGMIIGTMATAGAVMIYQETKGKSNKMMMKKGKQFAKKLGILQKRNKARNDNLALFCGILERNRTEKPYR